MPKLAAADRAAPRDVLLDVTRLVWRSWKGRYPTGIDRVCLAYVDHFNCRARAVIQRRGIHRVLTIEHSRRLFDLLKSGVAPRWRLANLLAEAALASSAGPGAPRAIYLNVGHTGLDEPTLEQWIARHRLRAIYLVHDLIPLTHPQFCRSGERAKHERRMRNLLASASGVIGNSRATIDELARFARVQGLAMPPSLAAWLGVPTMERPKGGPPLDVPYFVIVGTIEARKNHILLLQAWRELISRLGVDAPVLVVVGQRGWKADATFALLDEMTAESEKIMELNHCPDAELAAWVAGARALLMPSFVEGFGLPIIEALQLGTPAIASDLPVFREIADDIPTFLPVDATEQWVQRIAEFVSDVPERARQVERIRQYRAPDWPSHFAIVDAWLADSSTAPDDLGV